MVAKNTEDRKFTLTISNLSFVEKRMPYQHAAGLCYEKLRKTLISKPLKNLFRATPRFLIRSLRNISKNTLPSSAERRDSVQLRLHYHRLQLVKESQDRLPNKREPKSNEDLEKLRIFL